MKKTLDLARLLTSASVKDQYKRQLSRLKKSASSSEQIVDAVEAVINKLPRTATNSLVIYGDPQSGKTEMMICLTARLLDEGHRTIIHLMTDSVELLNQSLDRFKLAALAPSPRNAADLANSPLTAGHNAILFCKKNSKDLQKLIVAIEKSRPIVVIDDEADYATPNAKINKREQTKINKLVSDLLGRNGVYIGVTATPARLNLNNTFNNRTETWVRFRPHDAYTGQEVFFPQEGPLSYRCVLLTGPGNADDARRALARFCVTAAYLNTSADANGEPEQNYSFLIHTSGKTDDHATDRKTIETTMNFLVSRKGAAFKSFVDMIYEQSQALYPDADPDLITQYVVANASRNAFIVLNSKSDRVSGGAKPTEPTCPFTIIIGGNIVSRGVTFNNLLAMFFTRDVKTKLQQDTYIQRARMFGARGKYLEHFELTIPEALYGDWKRCFVFHRLALETINKSQASPVWIGDDRISIAASSSVDRSTVDLNHGEMSFELFDCGDVSALDSIVDKGSQKVETLESLAAVVGDALPQFLIDYLKGEVARMPNALAIHKSSSIEGQKGGVDHAAISRPKGFIGKSQLEQGRFPSAVHHIKVFHNGRGKARIFFKNIGGAQFVQNQRGQS